MPPWSTCGANTMEIQKDFSELLALFNEHEVAYIIVGGYALAFHGAPRNTGDIDILVRAESGCVPGPYGDTPVRFLGRTEFVSNKRTTGRSKDRADLEALGVDVD